MAVDKKLRRKYYNLCDPRESLAPDDDRNVDVDVANKDSRGRNWVDALAARIELSSSPVCEFFTGLPGSGKSTELRRLAARLAEPGEANLLPVLIDAEEVLDIYNPIDVPDILIAILFKTDAAVLAAENKDPADALKESRFKRFWRWLTTAEISLESMEVEAEVKGGLPEVAEASASGKVVLDLKSSPSLREAVRKKVAAHMTTFVHEVKEEIEALDARAKGCERAGIVILFDSLEKLRGISNNWTEVLTSAERVFTGGAPYLRLPVHVLYTLPPAVVLRLQVQVTFLPMLKLFDRKNRKRDAGFEAAWKIIRKRVPEEHLKEFFGATTMTARVERLIEWSGGYPRDIVRLLQTFIAEPALDEAMFERLLSLAADEYRRTVPESALPWLRQVRQEQRLIIHDDGHRETVDLMLQNNVVLRYQNNDPWVDLHPAIGTMLDEIDARAAEMAGSNAGTSA